MSEDIARLLLEYHTLTPEPKKSPKWITFQQQYRDDWVACVHDCFIWDDKESGPAFYQDEIIDTMSRVNRQAVRGPRGLGKTAMAAWLVWVFALTRDGDDWKIPTTASAWRQLTRYLWPEIHKWGRRLRFDKIGRSKFNPNTELMGERLKLETGQAFALASDQPDLIEGAHANRMFALFDESKTIPNSIFDAAEGAFSTPGEIKVLAISTPGPPIGRFFDIHMKKKGYQSWVVRHVTQEEAIRAGRLSPEWCEMVKVQWGEDSSLYRNQALGEFATSDENGLIPLSWVEKAVERWEARMKSEEGVGPFTCVGVDVARGGADDTTIAIRHSDVIKEVKYYDTRDTMVIAGKVVNLIKNGGYAIVDVIGVGAGVVDRVREQELVVNAFHAAARTNHTDRSGEMRFLNKRAAAWWKMREALDPQYDSQICLPPDGKLMEDLTTPLWWETSSGLIQVEGKDDIRKRIGRSTDAGDSVVMAFYEETPGEINFY